MKLIFKNGEFLIRNNYIEGIDNDLYFKELDKDTILISSEPYDIFEPEPYEAEETFPNVLLEKLEIKLVNGKLHINGDINEVVLNNEILKQSHSATFSPPPQDFFFNDNKITEIEVRGCTFVSAIEHFAISENLNVKTYDDSTFSIRDKENFKSLVLNSNDISTILVRGLKGELIEATALGESSITNNNTSCVFSQHILAHSNRSSIEGEFFLNKEDVVN